MIVLPRIDLEGFDAETEQKIADEIVSDLWKKGYRLVSREEFTAHHSNPESFQAIAPGMEDYIFKARPQGDGYALTFQAPNSKTESTYKVFDSIPWHQFPPRSSHHEARDGMVLSGPYIFASALEALKQYMELVYGETICPFTEEIPDSDEPMVLNGWAVTWLELKVFDNSLKGR